MKTLALAQPFLNPELANYSKELNKDEWQPNSNWRIESYWESNEAPSGHRWQYGTSEKTSELVESLLQPAKTTFSIAISSDPIDEGNRPSPVVAEPMISRLARIPSLSGWNAAILWANTDPQAARKIAPVLEEIVLGQCQYQVFFPTTEVESSSKPITVQRGQSPDRAEEKPTSVRQNQDVDQSDWLDSLNPFQGERNQNSRTLELSLKMRAAAAEAWCRVLASQPGSPVDHLAPVGRALSAGKLPPSIQAELIRNVAHYVAPRDIPNLEEALSPASENPANRELQKAALDACLIYAWENIYQPQKSVPVAYRKQYD
ncbi:MAG: hypothetical protein KDA65_17765, partial [Planctomycetaceae bacterium]|nr:hypothetical protein [Planctomycetaceae bacterium]